MYIICTMQVNVLTYVNILLQLLKEIYLNYHKQSSGGNMNIKGAAGEGAKGNEECVTENCSKEDHCNRKLT